MSTHLDRKTLKRPDAFLERINSAFAYLADNSRLFLAGLALLFAVGLGAAFMNSYSDKKAEEADSALFDARKTVDDAVAKLKDLPKGAEAKPAAEVLAAAKPGLDQVEKVAATFSGSRAAFEARLLLGDMSFRYGQYQQAAEQYKQAVDSARPRAAKPIAQYSLAFAYENLKNHDGAIEALRQVVASGNSMLKSDAEMALARNYALKGDKPRALEQYQQVVKDFPNTPTSKQAEAEISHLK
ncbi:MAG: tetratricopeptide repeat protein [Deltaproteobacteria bacterium]|nr:tetratricopeptide repeat protein [Deltaproteobacteria bacterium]